MKVITEGLLTELYINKHMPMHEVAKELNVAVGTVYNYLKKYNIKSRSVGDYEPTEAQREAGKRAGAAKRGKVLSVETKLKISEGHKLSGEGHKKLRTDGYVYVYYPKHVNATKDGYIMEHHLVMEKHIGRPISKGEVVHHRNHIRNDNSIENLQLMTFSEHARYHMELRNKEREDNG